MTACECADLVLVFATRPYVSGQATEQMVDAANRLGRALGLRTTIIPRWGELELVAESEDAALAVRAVAAPAGVEMERVASTMRAIFGRSRVTHLYRFSRAQMRHHEFVSAVESHVKLP